MDAVMETMKSQATIPSRDCGRRRTTAVWEYRRAAEGVPCFCERCAGRLGGQALTVTQPQFAPLPKVGVAAVISRISALKFLVAEVGRPFATSSAAACGTRPDAIR